MSSLTKQLEELALRERHALAMGGEEKLARRKAAGILNARERVDYLVDPDSFIGGCTTNCVTGHCD